MVNSYNLARKETDHRTPLPDLVLFLLQQTFCIRSRVKVHSRVSLQFTTRKINSQNSNNHVINVSLMHNIQCWGRFEIEYVILLFWFEIDFAAVDFAIADDIVCESRSDCTTSCRHALRYALESSSKRQLYATIISRSCTTWACVCVTGVTLMLQV